MAAGVAGLAKRAGGLALRGAAVGIGVLTAAAAAGSVKLVGLASTAEETANVFSTVLGKGSPAHKAATAFVSDLGKSSGIATQELQQAVGSFAVLGKQAGKTGPELATFATELTQAGLDLGSFYNKSPEEVFGAIQSGLTGEAEALKQLNIFMTEAALNTYALEQGIGKTTQQMTEQEKIALRQGFIMSQLGDANGDLARTSDGFANRLRYLKGRLTEAGTVIGTFLLPYANQLVTALGDRVGGAVGSLSSKLPELERRLQAGADVMGRLRDSFEAGGTTGLVSHLDVLTGSGGNLRRAFDEVKSVLDDVTTIVRDALAPAITDAASAIDPAWLSPIGAARLALGFLADNADRLRFVLTGLILYLTLAKAATIAHTVVTTVATGVTIARAFATALLTGAVTAGAAAEGARNASIAAGIGLQLRMAAAMAASAARTVASTVATVAHRAVVLAVSAATRVWAAGQWLLNAALTANPIGLVVAAIALLVGGLVLAYNKSDTFRAAVQKVWELLKRFVGFTPLGALIKNLDKVVDLGRKAKDALGNLGGKLNPFGDTAASHARGPGHLGTTLAAHARYAGPGVKISNALVGGGGKGHGSGDHQAGRALDLVGSGLGRYASRVRADGGYAAYHGSGPTRHLHAVPAAMGDTSRSMVRAAPASSSSASSAPAAPTVVIGEGAIIVSGLTVDEARVAIADGIRDYVRDTQERA